MRDKRESTQANAEAVAASEVLADRLPKVLASRLRAARSAAGLPQGVVAKAMSDRGFSWRQTTVAKSEAADRPVLFAEVAALSQIYRRPIEYFLYPGTGLDSLLDQSLSELDSIKYAIADTYAQLRDLKSDQKLHECAVGLASAIVRYRNTSDSGPLLDDLQGLLHVHGRLVLDLDDVYESLDLEKLQLDEIDKAVLQEIARMELQRYGRLSQNDLQGESSELLTGLSDFMEGKEVSDDLISVLRKGADWASYVSVPLADLLMDAVKRHAL